MDKEFHIICSGVSIITNAQRNGIIPQDKKIADEKYWQNLLDNPKEIEKLKSFVESDPYKHSAELNTFLRAVKDKDQNNIEVYLFGTNTSSNELCRRVIESILKDRGFKLYTPYEASGYFWEAKMYDVNYAKDEFKRGISELLGRLIYLARKKKEEGYKIYFNPTAGLKAHVIATALASYFVDAESYYMNEEFDEIVYLPKLFYLPKGKEVELLKILYQESIISDDDVAKLISTYKDEIERLFVYGLIEQEKDELNKIYRLRITQKGKVILDQLNIELV